MLIKITEKCRMGCTHCMDDARADLENHMDFDTFKKSVDFSLRFENIFLISGGEPTEHPNFWEFMDYLAGLKERIAVCVATNGMNLTENDAEKMDTLSNKINGEIYWQVTNVRPYYPKRIWFDDMPKIYKRKDVFITRKLEKLEMRGRASQHRNFIFNSKAPQCFNLRSISRSVNDFGIALELLRQQQKFCTPSIRYDGSIVLGESRLCPSIGTIYNSDETLISNIVSFTCDCPDCWETLKKMDDIYLHAIGEERNTI